MWQSMSKQELEKQYSASRWCRLDDPKYDAVHMYLKATKEGSDRAKSSLSCELGIPYGDREEQKLDVFGAKTLPGDAPIFVFLHGGYWQEGCLAESSYMAPPLVDAGAVCVSLGYVLAPKASLPEIVEQVRVGIRLVLDMATRRGSRGVYLSGHSAGGHLVAMMLATDWGTSPDQSLIKGAILVSGVYDLRPLVQTYVNDPIKMTPEIAWEQSPANHIASIAKHAGKCVTSVVIGERDPPEFHRQSQELTKALQDGGVEASMTQINDTDHFTIVWRLQQPKYQLTQMIVKMMGLQTPEP